MPRLQYDIAYKGNVIQEIYSFCVVEGIVGNCNIKFSHEMVVPVPWWEIYQSHENEYISY